MPKVKYDADVDAVYIGLVDIEPGGIDKTIEIKENVFLDFDKENVLVGIEILGTKYGEFTKKKIGL
jgi:uncharacterized protein YuzE